MPSSQRCQVGLTSHSCGGQTGPYRYPRRGVYSPTSATQCQYSEMKAATDEIDEGDFFASCLFLAAAELIICADALYLEADQAERRGCPRRAYNLTRRADYLMKQARRLCGDKGLPWGIV